MQTSGSMQVCKGTPSSSCHVSCIERMTKSNTVSLFCFFPVVDLSSDSRPWPLLRCSESLQLTPLAPRRAAKAFDQEIHVIILSASDNNHALAGTRPHSRPCHETSGRYPCVWGMVTSISRMAVFCVRSIRLSVSNKSATLTSSSSAEPSD